LAKKNKEAAEAEVKDQNTPEGAENETQEPETAQESTPEKATEKAPEKSELEEQKERYLRLAAEYDNFRKRSQREKETVYSDAAADTIAAFLPVLDNLDRALTVETADEAFKKGVLMIQKQFYDCLEKLKCSEIEAKGEQFDPNLHNAVMHVDDETVDDNTVVEVFQKGFKINDRVIRHAMVKVAN